jgi:ATP-dependent protease ClpP protease subunit
MDTLVCEPILIEGHLDREKLDHACHEIMAAHQRNRQIVLVISSDGGKMDACVDFVTWLEKEKKDFSKKVSAKIYTASSGAALIALCADTRSISTNGLFGLHIGSLTVESSDISTKGLLAKRLTTLLQSSHDLTLRLLQEKVPHLPMDKLSTLHAKGQLLISPAECVAYGLCSKIF